ncbi:MAG: hypothetical protein ACO1N0_04195 [Fluviicola sp.]
MLSNITSGTLLQVLPICKNALYASMKRLLFFCLLLIQSSGWSQSDTARFVIRTYGFSSWDEYDQIEDSIAGNWSIAHLPVAGCLVTDEFVDSIERLNKITYGDLQAHYGSDWKERFKLEVDSAYQELLYKKKHTFKKIAHCTTDKYTFNVAENLNQTEMKFTVIPKKAANQNNNEVRIMGLQNRDHTILYRGYDNRIILEFGSFADTINASLKSKGNLQLMDSCPASTKVAFGYRVSGSFKQDTLLVETTDDQVHPFVFNIKNLPQPDLYFNEQVIDSTMPISKFYTTSVLSMHYDKDCLVPGQFTIQSWELWYSGGKKPINGKGNIIPMSVIRKLKKLKPGDQCGMMVKVIGPDSVQRKKSADFKMI